MPKTGLPRSYTPSRSPTESRTAARDDPDGQSTLTEFDGKDSADEAANAGQMHGIALPFVAFSPHASVIVISFSGTDV